ncbi:MAG: class I SAM-dependent methyltransferase [Mucilaginibacter sp.]
MTESFQPIAVKSLKENSWLFFGRCLVDLQLLTIFNFLSQPLSTCRGRVLDVGAGQSPWRDLLTKEAEYVGVDIESATEFAMTPRQDITYYDGQKLPYDDSSFEHVLCIEVLEHAINPTDFLTEINRVLRSGGTLILTIPWSARLHHLPHDYTRFTRFGLTTLLEAVGFTDVIVEERGNDLAVISNKLLVLMIGLLRPERKLHRIWTWGLAFILAPVAFAFLSIAHISLFLKTGYKNDPLGYGVIAVKV